MERKTVLHGGLGLLSLLLCLGMAAAARAGGVPQEIRFYVSGFMSSCVKDDQGDCLLPFEPGDVLGFDPALDMWTVLFDASTHNIPPECNLDAVFRRNAGEIVFSFAPSPINCFNAAPEDLRRAQLKPGSPVQMVADFSDIGLSVASEDVDGITLGPGPRIQVNTFGPFAIPAEHACNGAPLTGTGTNVLQLNDPAFGPNTDGCWTLVQNQPTAALASLEAEGGSLVVGLSLACDGNYYVALPAGSWGPAGVYRVGPPLTLVWESSLDGFDGAYIDGLIVDFTDCP